MAYKRRGSAAMAWATLWRRCCCCCWLAQLPLVVHAVVDVVAQLHHLQQHQAASASGSLTAGTLGEKIVLQNVPGALSKRLSEKQLRWQDLSSLQQRALLWDTGLVLTSEGRLVQVFVPCGKTMSQIFLPREAFESSAPQKKKVCAVESCSTHPSVRFASANCSVTAVQRIAQCAVEDDDEVGATAVASSNSSLWLEDGDIESVPDIRVYRYQVWTATGSIAISNSPSSTTTTSGSSSSSSSGGGTVLVSVKNESTPILFTINQQRQTADPGSGRCSTGEPFFIAPCIQRVAANRDEWCAPARGGYLDFWFDAEINASTSGGAPTANSSSSSSAGMSTASIVLIVLSALVVGVLAGFGASRLYRKAQQQLQRGKGLTVTTMRASGSEHESLDEIPTLSGAEYRQSIPALLSNPAQLFANTMREEAAMMMLTTTNNSSSNALGNSTHSGNSVLQGSDIAALNESICRRSIEMSTFCADRVLMGKRIQYAEITFEKMLARGANGEVWKGEFAGQVVAIKQLLQEKRHDKNAIEQFAKEIRLASSLEHPNIVKFVGFSWKRLSDMCTVSEFMGKGDLSDLINSTLSGRMTWNQEKLSIAIDIANALACLHSLDPLIIHRDLKSLNVLLNDNLEAKLSDFGLSRTRSFEETMTCGVGTLLWTAPEILRGEAYTEKADIFSYGIVLSELDTCLPPYALNDEVSKQQLTSMQLINLVAKGGIKPKFRGDIPVALEHLATSCVAEDPAKRPNAMQIVLALTSKVISSHVSKS